MWPLVNATIMIPIKTCIGFIYIFFYIHLTIRLFCRMVIQRFWLTFSRNVNKFEYYHVNVVASSCIMKTKIISFFGRVWLTHWLIERTTTVIWMTEERDHRFWWSRSFYEQINFSNDYPLYVCLIISLAENKKFLTPLPWII